MNNGHTGEGGILQVLTLFLAFLDCCRIFRNTFYVSVIGNSAKGHFLYIRRDRFVSPRRDSFVTSCMCKWTYNICVNGDTNYNHLTIII